MAQVLLSLLSIWLVEGSSLASHDTRAYDALLGATPASQAQPAFSSACVHEKNKRARVPLVNAKSCIQVNDKIDTNPSTPQSSLALNARQHLWCASGSGISCKDSLVSLQSECSFSELHTKSEIIFTLFDMLDKTAIAAVSRERHTGSGSSRC